MEFKPFHEYFHELAQKEIREFTMPEHSNILPVDTYGLMEFYCDKAECDCRRVMFYVYSHKSNQLFAVINFGWEGESFYKRFNENTDKKSIKLSKGPELDLLSKQSEYAPKILEFMKYVILEDEDYVKRLKKHYQLFKDEVNRRYIKQPKDAGLKISRNDPCLCGSGKKYKKCCMNK